MFIHEPTKIISNSRGVYMSLWEAIVCQITSQEHCGEEEPEEGLVTFLLWSKEAPLLAFVTPGV